MVIGGDRSSYRSDYMTEYDDYATLGSRTPTTSSIGMIVRPKIRSVSSHGSLTSKGKREGDKAVPTSSPPIIGESAGMFTDMTDTMLKVLDRRMAVTAQARELENTLAEKAYALGHDGQNVTDYLPKSVTSVSLSAQPLYMNTVPRTTKAGIPIAESTPIPQVGPTLHRPTPTPQVHDILEPVASEQARARYLEEEIRHIKGICLTPSEGRSIEKESLYREIQEYCSQEQERCQYEKETHYAMLDSMIDNKIKQRQLEKRERDEIYKQMTSNLKKVRAIARDSLSRASTISVEERQMALTETDFLHIKEKMNKIDRKIQGLYQNWQAEHREAITSEQCDAIQIFYKPYESKYETKYKILYQMLKQAIEDRSKIPSFRVSASELTPSLVALKDASTLKRKEWERVKPNIEKPHMYSTREGRLTPTAPAYEDMRMATPFQVTTVESQEGLSAAEGGEEIERATQQPSDHIEGSESRGVLPISIEYRPDVLEERIRQEDMSKGNEITRESSKEDALATTRRFCSNVTEGRNATEVPVTTTTSVSQTDTPHVTSMPVETERPEPSPVSTFPPSGTPPRPIATATLRPRTLEQRRSKGQVEEQSQDDDESEDDTIEPLVMEGLSDELGPEWRILHPFDIPGVRNPTEDTPPTHRRLAENETLVELIQTAEYLEDAPSWEQRRFYPPRYGDPFYRGCGQGCGRGRGRGRGWLHEDVPGRDLDGQGRFHFHGNGRDGFPSSHDEGRRDIRLELPPVPGPSRHLDWSSEASPPARTAPHSALDVPPAQNQLNVPPAETTRSERIDVGNAERVTIASQTEPIREGQDIHVRPAAKKTRSQRNDFESSEGENIHDIPPVPIRSARLSLHTDDVVLMDAPQGANVDNGVTRSSQVRYHTIEGISSICPVDSNITSGIRQITLDERGCGQTYQFGDVQQPTTSTINRRDPSDSDYDHRSHRERGHVNERGRPPERDRYLGRDRRPPRQRAHSNGRPP